MFLDLAIIPYLSCNILGRKFQYIWYFMNPNAKIPVGISWLILLASLLDDIFEFMNPEIFYSIDNRRHM